MDLSHFSDRDMQNIRVFSADHDQETVAHFLSGQNMRLSGFELCYERHPEFQKLLKWQGPKYATFLKNSPSNETLAMFSISVNHREVFGEIVPVGYVGDFRTDGSRRAALFWRKAYLPLLQEAQKSVALDRPRHFITAVLKSNTEAIRSLTSQKHNLPFSYDFLQEQNMVNVFSAGIVGASKYQAELALPPDEAELRDFLQEQSRRQTLSYDFSREWDFRKQCWPNFSTEQFYVIRIDGRIRACALPWAPTTAKRMRIGKAATLVESALKLTNRMGLAMPSTGEVIKTLYLTHLYSSLEFDESVRAFLRLAKRQRLFREFHMISFAEGPGENVTLPLQLHQRTKVSLYRVRAASEPPWPQLPTGKISFEMALV